MRRMLKGIKSAVPGFYRCCLCAVLLVSTAQAMPGMTASEITASSSASAPGLRVSAGQSVTQLPDGRWLLLGGPTANAPVSSEAVLVDPKTGYSQPLNTGLIQARAAHSATLLPDGTVFIFGGQGADGQVIAHAEQFDPFSAQFNALAPLGLSARSAHSATVLADGRLLIAGGLDEAGQPRTDADRYNPLTGQTEPLASRLSSGRLNPLAVLLPDASVLLWGGQNADGKSLETGERFDPATQEWTLVDTAEAEHGLQALLSPGMPVLAESRPVAEATEVALNQPLRVRFNQWMDVTTLNTDSVTLVGPRGVTGIRVTPVEHGLLLFVTPKQELLPGSRYTLFIDGAANLGGQRLPFNVLGFTTLTLTGQETPDTHPENGDTGSTDSDVGSIVITPPAVTTEIGEDAGKAADDAADANQAEDKAEEDRMTGDDPAITADDIDEVWIPGAQNYRGEWISHRAELAERALPKRPETLRGHRQARLMRDGRLSEAEIETLLPTVSKAATATALAGQTLKLNGKPLPGVTIRIGPQSAVTDGNGEFWLGNIPSGTVVLEIDGRSSSTEHSQYGRYFYQMHMEAGQINTLPQPIWMVKLDTEHAVKIPSPTTEEVVIRNPYLPGMEVRLPADTVIRDADGKIVTEVSLTPVPVDQTPIPMPYGGVPIYYTLQPGGALIQSVSGQPQGVKITYPNYSTQPPGARFELFDHDPHGRGWYLYGKVQVSADGKRIEGDKDFILYQFQASSTASGGDDPPDDPPPPEDCKKGNPVSCYTGLFVQTYRDLSIDDVIPLTLAREYRTQDPNQRAFGVGGTHNFDAYLYFVDQLGFTATQIDLVIDHGTRIAFKAPVGSSGDTRTETYRSQTPGIFYGATLKGTHSLRFDLRLKDGTVYEFSWHKARLRAIQDRWGNRLGITRDASNRVTRITSPNGRSISFRYGHPACTRCVTQVIDSASRRVDYQYDTTGRMTQVTDTGGGITTFEYNAEGNQTVVKDPRYHAGQVTQPKVINTYYTAADGAFLEGRVKQQTYADGSTTQFTYAFDPNGMLTHTDTTNGRGIVERLEYTPNAQVARRIRALGQPEEQTTDFVYDSATGLQTSRTDALGRTSAYEYDSQGNLTQVTRLAGTPDAVSTQLTYTGAFNQVASLSDPLGRTTHFTYDHQGSLVQITDGNGNSVVQTYNAKGQLTSTTNTLGETIHYVYSGGDLVQLTDPLNRSTRLTTDVLGRINAITDPRGRTEHIQYNTLDQRSQSQDALNQVTGYAYDPNGNLTQVADAKGNRHGFAYGNRDQVSSQDDPLGQASVYQYDNELNITQETDRNDQVTQYAYDALDRLINITFHDGSTIAYSYDAANRVTQIVDSLNGTITNTYDNLDRLIGQTTPKGSVSYTYYANGLRQTMTVNGQPTLTYSYDAGNRLVRIDQAAGAINNNTAQHLAFSYDAANRQTQTRLANGQTIHYGYDDASQLIAIVYKNANGTVAGDLLYAYDETGRRTQVGGSLVRTDLPADGSGSVNAGNRLITQDNQSLSYDANGNLINDGVNTYTWNARNQLVQISGATTASFTYDALGRRQTKTINGVSTGYFYDGFNLVQELEGLMTTNNNPADIRAHYWMGGIDQVFAQQTGTQTLNYWTDALGSTIRLTDAAGAKVVDYTYEPYGNTSADAAVDNPFQYTGRENDGTGLYYYRARYYSPVLQRFISEDPIGLEGGINVYSYVDGDPVSLTDPEGLATTLMGCANPRNIIGCSEAMGASRIPPLASPIAVPIPKCEVECDPPEGTVCFIIDRVPPSKPHYSIEGSHYHLWQMNRDPKTNKCHWNGPVASKTAPPGAIPCPFVRPPRRSR